MKENLSHATNKKLVEIASCGMSDRRLSRDVIPAKGFIVVMGEMIARRAKACNVLGARIKRFKNPATIAALFKANAITARAILTEFLPNVEVTYQPELAL